MPQLVRGDPDGSGCRPRASTSLVACATTASTTSWRMLCRERGFADRGDEHWIVRSCVLGCGLVLGQDFPEQRQHVDLAHACVGLVPADHEPSVGEIHVAPKRRPGSGSPAAAQEQRGDRRAPACRQDRVALGPSPAVAVHGVNDGFAAVELAGRLEQDCNLLGAIQLVWYACGGPGDREVSANSVVLPHPPTTRRVIGLKYVVRGFSFGRARQWTSIASSSRAVVQWAPSGCAVASGQTPGSCQQDRLTGHRKSRPCWPSRRSQGDHRSRARGRGASRRAGPGCSW